MGTLITRLINLHSDWSSGFRDSRVAPHWSFLHSLSQLVSDTWWRFTSAFRAGSLVICHHLRSLHHPEYRPESVTVGRHAGALQGGSRQGPKNGFRKILNTSVDIHTTVVFQIEQNI
jgi:hypothetical protein